MRSRHHRACDAEIERLTNLAVVQAERIRELERLKNVWMKLAVHCARQANAERFGIWGGLSSVNRQRVRNPREPRPVTHPSWKAYQTGCRCDPCRQMNAEYMRARRIRIRQERTVTPGAQTRRPSN